LSKEEKTLYLTPKMGLVPEVSTQTYETIAKQFREVVSNSVDAGAQNVTISINTSGERTYVLVSDDGEGMSLKDFKEQFLALGGSLRYYDEHKIGRIGIGFLAVAPICEYVDIYSRRKGSNEAFQAKLWLSKLVDKHFRLEEIKDFPVGEIVEIVPDADASGLEEHYTKLYLQNITEPARETLAGPKFDRFERELRTILPLKYPDKCKLFEHISPKLRALLEGEADKNRANVYLNSDEPMTRRVYGEGKGENFGHVAEVLGHEVAGVKVIGYFVDNQAKIRKWNGLVTRVLNVAVEDSGFLGYEGLESAQARVTGELHLVGIDKTGAISINRNRFNEANLQYRSVQGYVHQRLKSFFGSVYNRVLLRSEINKRIRQIKSIPVALETASTALSPIATHQPRGLTESKLRASIGRARSVDLLKIDLGDKFKEHATIEIIPELEPQWRKKGYKVEWTGADGTIGHIFVGKDILDPDKSALILDHQEYKVRFVKAEALDRPCEIDFEKRLVIFNDSSPLVSEKDEDLLFFLLTASYCYQVSKSKDQFYSNLLNALLYTRT